MRGEVGKQNNMSHHHHHDAITTIDEQYATKSNTTSTALLRLPISSNQQNTTGNIDIILSSTNNNNDTSEATIQVPPTTTTTKLRQSDTSDNLKSNTDNISSSISNAPSLSKKRRNNLTKLSHQLSLGLRHKAIDFGWNITPDGYVPVQEILQHDMFRNKYTLDDIIETVQSNDKQRYTLQERPLKNYYKTRDGAVDDVATGTTPNHANSTILCIRANQGHSISMINSDLLLQRLSSDDLLQNYPIMVHGTNYDAWERIQSSGGLNKMQRNHIHFATDIPSAGRNGISTKTNNTVISGMRKSCNVYIYINIHKCIQDNISIYQSDNGVLLTAGVDDSGILPMQYFSHVTDSTGNLLYMQTEI